MEKATKPEPSLYKLECITDNPKYEGFAFIQEDSLRGTSSLSDDFMPDDIQSKGRAWTVTRMAPFWSPQTVEGRVRAFNDYPCVNMLIPAFSRRAVDALKDFLEPNGELLPLVSNAGEYYAYNITTVADILDHEHSDIQWFTGVSSIALNINHYACYPEKLSGLSIFRVVEKPSSTYVSHAFVDRVRKHKLEGFHFIKLWSAGKRIDWRKEDRKEERRNATVTPGVDSKLAAANTVVILLPTAKAKPSKREKDQLSELMDELDGVLYDPKASGEAPYLGSLEGNDHSKRYFRLFVSCPDADVLVDKLHPWLKGISWPEKVEVVKRYGEYTNHSCREEVVEL